MNEFKITDMTDNSNKIYGKPVKIISWRDKYTNAIGWIVINSLVNDIAGGGLFMHPGASLKEVMDLAKSMTYKNCVISNPIMGGAKGGIKFNNNDPGARNVLARFLLDHKSIIEHEWCTGGDLNTSNEVIEAIIKQEIKLPTAFTCLARKISEIEKITDQSLHMVSRLLYPLNEWFNIGNCATGYSVSQIIKLIVDKKKPRILIQGFGKVGSSLAYFIQNLNLGLIVGILEKDGYIYNESGIDVFALIKAKSAKQDSNSVFSLKSFLTPEQCVQYHWTSATGSNSETLSNFFKSISADVFCPCAERYSIDVDIINSFIKPELQQYIISGANNPFASSNVIQYCLNKNIMMVPDWVSNAGNAILFVELLKSKHWSSDSANEMLAKISHHLQNFLNRAKEIQYQYNYTTLFQSCYLVAKQKLLLIPKTNNSFPFAVVETFLGFP